MLAAAEGHIPVMKILLDNHAAVNYGDKMKARTFIYHHLLAAVVVFSFAKNIDRNLLPMYRITPSG